MGLSLDDGPISVSYDKTSNESSEANSVSYLRKFVNFNSKS